LRAETFGGGALRGARGWNRASASAGTSGVGACSPLLRRSIGSLVLHCTLLSRDIFANENN
jgi:hypothetical protein